MAATRRLGHPDDLTIAGHASIHDTARALRLTPSILYGQVTRLERRCGVTLIQRSPRPADAGTLTPLGEQLRRQARDYIGLSVTPGQQTSNITPGPRQSHR